MFKDFHRRLQRDLKRIVDARMVTSNAQVIDDVKVSSLINSLFACLCQGLIFLLF